jgi:hypothetical protein
MYIVPGLRNHFVLDLNHFVWDLDKIIVNRLTPHIIIKPSLNFIWQLSYLPTRLLQSIVYCFTCYQIAPIHWWSSHQLTWCVGDLRTQRQCLLIDEIGRHSTRTWFVQSCSQYCINSVFVNIFKKFCEFSNENLLFWYFLAHAKFYQNRLLCLQGEATRWWLFKLMQMMTNSWSTLQFFACHIILAG